jgi:hypothetical protein
MHVVFQARVEARLWRFACVVFLRMGRPSPSSRLAALAAIVAVAAIVIPAVAGAGILPKPPKAELATTGNASELLKTVPIGTKQNAKPRVVMSLSPDNLEPIAAGDRLRASGEMQVSTTCVAPGPRCLGRPYQINPTITARIVLADSPDATAPSMPLSQTTTRLCKQQRPNRNHHCTLAIPNLETTIPDPNALPCPPTACYVNLIVTASNKKAKRGNLVVVGADEPDGSVKQDKGRLNVVQAHANVPPPSQSSTTNVITPDLPVTLPDRERKRVVYSLPISAPQKGEVLAFDATFGISINALRYNSFIASRVILADSPTATDSDGIAKPTIPFRGQATESNGFNCTLGLSGYSNPCTVVKAGATRVSRDAVDPTTGLPATLYLNVLVSAKPLLAEKPDPSAHAAVTPSGPGFVVYRYSP